MGGVIRGAAIGASVAGNVYISVLLLWMLALLTAPFHVGEIDQGAMFAVMLYIVAVGAVWGWLNDRHS